MQKPDHGQTPSRYVSGLEACRDDENINGSRVALSANPGELGYSINDNKPVQMKVTIADIAKLAQVSKGTVSAVINNKPNIAPKTRERVMTVIEKVNYRPSQLARSLSTRATRHIGLLIKEIDNPYFSRIIKGVFDKSLELGYTVLLGSSELDPQQERSSIDALLAQHVDGMILSPLQDDSIDFGYLTRMQQQNIPIVSLNSVTNHRLRLVDIDHYAAARTAVSYLMYSGHRQLAYLAGPPFSTHSAERQRAFVDVLQEHDIPIRRNVIFRCGSHIKDGARAAEQILAASPRPTAVLCFNDLVAIGLMTALIDKGIRIPEDISVIGFDDIAYAEHFRVPLTTVAIPTHKIGETAAIELIAAIQQKPTEPGEPKYLPHKLIKRRSVARV